MRRLTIVLLLTLTAACSHPPPNLSPTAKLDFNNTRVIKALDLIRDTAIDANAQVPPLVTTETVRKVINFHKAAIAAIDADKAGWRGVVGVLLFKLQADPSLLPGELAYLQQYFNLARALIDSLAQTTTHAPQELAHVA